LIKDLRPETSPGSGFFMEDLLCELSMSFSIWDPEEELSTV
jgi:hypothetical protein